MNSTESSSRRFILGVDVGGTHTDIELIEIDTGRVFQHKILSTPEMPSKAIGVGTAEIIAQARIDPAAIQYFANGTTVATNALVQKRTATAGLITTKGFRDLLEIRRQRQPHIYNIDVAKPVPPALRRHRHEVVERKYLFGRDDVAPREDDVVGAAREMIADGVKAIAVCFLNSYDDPAHERLARGWLAKHFPDTYMTASFEVLPEFREYERVSTAVLNASLGPVMKQYLENIVNDARINGLVVEPKILQSNGGVASPEDASRYPVRTLASGPAAGVIGAIKVAMDLGEPNVITFDVGGTTADICLVENGEPLFASERDFAGYPVRFPMIDVLSIGAGGGSIAWLDAGGFLHVGPESAGAMPGPVCYGRGGTEPTVTDANLVLGRLNPAGLLGGRVPVNHDAARKAIQDKIATPMGLSVEEAAVGMLTILNENMLQAVRVTSVERGHDPREFSLVAFGGGGPLLAGQLAAELGMRSVIIPKSPGLLCAEGLLIADTRADFSKTRIQDLNADATEPIRA
ncbi:MAG: hydantoinase/oxoprolinase family protein, partial [Betaproteobacteria bacterium]